LRGGPLEYKYDPQNVKEDYFLPTRMDSLGGCATTVGTNVQTYDARVGTFQGVTSSCVAGTTISATTFYSGSTGLSEIFTASKSWVTPGVYSMQADHSHFDDGIGSTVMLRETTPTSYAQYTSAGSVLASAVNTVSDTPRAQASYQSAASIMGRR